MVSIRCFWFFFLSAFLVSATAFAQDAQDEGAEELQRRLAALPEASLEEFLDSRLTFQPVSILLVQNNRVVNSRDSYRVFEGEGQRPINAIRYAELTENADMDQDIRNRRRRTNLTYGIVTGIVAGITLVGVAGLGDEESTVPLLLAVGGATVLPVTGFAWLSRATHIKSVPAHLRSDQAQNEIFRYNVELLESLENEAPAEASPDTI